MGKCGAHPAHKGGLGKPLRLALMGPIACASAGAQRRFYIAAQFGARRAVGLNLPEFVMPHFESCLNAPMVRRTLCAALACAAFGVAAPAMAETKYPSKPVTLLVPFPPGSATDSMMRALGPAMSKTLGQPIVIENKPGASGTMAAAMLAQSKQPDGYQLAVAPATLFKVAHLQKVPYDPMKDLTYIVGFASYTYGLVVQNDAPYKTLAEFVTAAKASPNPITVATTGTGSSGHMATVELARRTGIKLESVPFKGGADGLTAFMGGHVQSSIDGNWAQVVRQAKGRALVTFSEKRLDPNVPTARELGYDVVARSPIGLVGPKGMDPKVVQAIQDAMKGAMSDPSFKKALETYDLGHIYLTSAEYRKVAEFMWVDEKKNLDMLGLIPPEMR